MRAAALMLCLTAGPVTALADMQCRAPVDDEGAQSISDQAPDMLPPPGAPSGSQDAGGAAKGLAPIAASEIARLPALKRIASAGAELTELGVRHGLRGIFARAGERFQVFYLAPDGQAVIGGVMWDALGQNVTRRQVAGIEGTIPTVTLGPAGTAPPRQATMAVSTPPADPLMVVESTSFGLAGSSGAPRVWMLIDPLCGHSVQAMERLRPLLASGALELAVVPVAVLDREPGGPSARVARLMLSQAPSAMVDAWIDQKLAGEPDPASVARLAANMAAAKAIRLVGTPTLVWRRVDGSQGRSDGLPADLAVVTGSIGG